MGNIKNKYFIEDDIALIQSIRSIVQTAGKVFQLVLRIKEWIRKD